MPDVRVLTGEALDAALDDVASLRIAVFRDWPYLYEGDLDYERRYLSTYRISDAAILVGAFEGARLVGAATGTPLADHAEEFQKAAARLPGALQDTFYFAESVLLPEYRGQGVGHGFFDAREAHARQLGASHSIFCAVFRPPDHPDCPANYRSLEPFWRKRGYASLPDVTVEFPWRDIGEAEETYKPMRVWHKTL